MNKAAYTKRTGLIISQRFDEDHICGSLGDMGLKQNLQNFTRRKLRSEVVLKLCTDNSRSSTVGKMFSVR